MTARQRSMLTKDDFALEPEIPSVTAKSSGKSMTAEQRQRRAQKRREQALKKREKEKKDTIERLLKKQDTKRGSNRTKHTKKNMKDCVKVKYSKDAICITFPSSIDGSYKPKEKIEQLPVQRLCEVPGCTNKRKYACSKTRKSLCSLTCYKKISS